MSGSSGSTFRRSTCPSTPPSRTCAAGFCATHPRPDILEQLRWLAGCGIEVHTQIVVTPGLNDSLHLERSVRDLVQFWPHVRSVSIVPVGITRHHKHGERPNTPAEMNAVLDRARRWQTEFRRKLGVRFVYPTDEWYLVTGRPIPPRAHYDGLRLEENGLGMVRAFWQDWHKIRRRIPNLKFPISTATLATGELFAPSCERRPASSLG